MCMCVLCLTTLFGPESIASPWWEWWWRGCLHTKNSRCDSTVGCDDTLQLVSPRKQLLDVWRKGDTYNRDGHWADIVEDYLSKAKPSDSDVLCESFFICSGVVFVLYEPNIHAENCNANKWQSTIQHKNTGFKFACSTFELCAKCKCILNRCSKYSTVLDQPHAKVRVQNTDKWYTPLFTNWNYWIGCGKESRLLCLQRVNSLSMSLSYIHL